MRYVLQVARTLMITSIPKEISDPGLITKHFQYTFPSTFNRLIKLTSLLMFNLCHEGVSCKDITFILMDSFFSIHQWGLPQLYCHGHPFLLRCAQVDEARRGEVQQAPQTGVTWFVNRLWVLPCIAGGKRWKAGCILPQRPKRRGRTWSRCIRAPRFSAVTSVASKRLVL